MATYRSLNKLEFKAHMNIHNFVEVPDAEQKGSAYTHDRFGKKHHLRTKSGRQRVYPVKKAALAIVAAVLWSVSPARPAQATVTPKSTNIQVDSRDLEPFSLNDRIGGKRGETTFYQDENKKLGINEDGDPSVSMRF